MARRASGSEKDGVSCCEQKIMDAFYKLGKASAADIRK
jgi:hypothetical protein